MDHAVDAFFQFHKRAVGGEVADLALDAGRGRILRRDHVPRVGVELADGEGNFLVFLAHAEDGRFHFLADREHVRGAGDALGPGEFGNVNEAFDAGFQFHKRAVRHEVGDLALDLHVDRILVRDLVPRIGGLLLEAERDTLFLTVDVEHEHFDFLAHLEHFARVVEAAPAHVGDVKQAVEAVEVDERAEVGDVLDHALDRAALLDAAEELCALLRPFGFNELAAGEDDVLALLVELDDLALEGLALVDAQVLGRDDVDLAAGQERLDADVEHEAALDHGLDLAADEPAVVENLDDLFPVLFLGRFFLGEDDHALVVLEALEENFDFAADFELGVVLELAQADDALGLVADVDEDFIRALLQHAALDDAALGKRTHRLPQQFLHGCTH